MNYGLVAEDYNSLKDSVLNIEDFKPNKYKSNNENFCKKLDELIIKIMED